MNLESIFLLLFALLYDLLAAKHTGKSGSNRLVIHLMKYLRLNKTEQI